MRLHEIILITDFLLFSVVALSPDLRLRIAHAVKKRVKQDEDDFRGSLASRSPALHKFSASILFLAC